MTHIILLDGKLWAFEPPEKPNIFDFPYTKKTWDKDKSDYDRAYSLALEQRIEVENPKVAIDWANGYLNLYTEAVRWEGTSELIKQFRPVGTAAWHDLTGVTVHDNSGFEFRKLIRLIAPVKEEKIISDFAKKFAESQKPMDPDIAKFVNDNFHELLEPVPSEQENLANYVDLKEEQENQEETLPFEFVEWYSGMSKDKIQRAYEKWLREYRTPAPHMY